MLQKLKRPALILCAVSVVWNGAAQAGTLQPNADGTVLDTATGFVWKRCLEGQTWTGQTCTGAAIRYTFDQATALTGKESFAGHNDWRLPNIRELLSIVDDTVSGNAIDRVAFPSGNVSLIWWSSSPDANGTTHAWNVYFNDGYSYSSFRNNSYSARLVRGGQALPNLNVTRPTSDYVDNGDGTVTHTPTQLMWQRCIVGQTWDGKACIGLASNMSWDSARAVTSNLAGRSDWRLPTRQELLSLVDYAMAAPPKLNAAIFPNAPAYFVWSGSPNTNDGRYAWSVSFFNGYSYPDNSHNSGVRLVRSVQSSAPLSPSSDTDCLLDWAEARLPDLLKPAHAPTQTAGTIQYRAYSATGIYLGVDGGTSVLALGGPVGANVVTLGVLSDFLPTARAASCQ